GTRSTTPVARLIERPCARPGSSARSGRRLQRAGSAPRSPGDDAEGGTALGFARGEHGAARGDRVAWVHGAEELDLVDAEEGPPRLGEVLDAEPDDRAEDEERMDDDVGVAVRAGVFGVEVERREGERHGGEESVVGHAEGPSPMV